MTPSPPAEKTTACQDQARQTSTGHGTRNADRIRMMMVMVMVVLVTLELYDRLADCGAASTFRSLIERVRGVPVSADAARELGFSGLTQVVVNLAWE